MRKYDLQKIEVLQKNLSYIRRIAGWTAEDLGDRIGVTKQTIRNLEKGEDNGGTKMTLTQYIAIRAILDAEIEEHPEKETLTNTVQLLLDCTKPFSKEDEIKIKKNMETIAVAASTGASQDVLNSLSKVLLIGIPIVAEVFLASVAMNKSGTSKWLKDLYKALSK